MLLSAGQVPEQITHRYFFPFPLVILVGTVGSFSVPPEKIPQMSKISFISLNLKRYLIQLEESLVPDRPEVDSVDGDLIPVLPDAAFKKALAANKVLDFSLSFPNLISMQRSPVLEALLLVLLMSISLSSSSVPWPPKMETLLCSSLPLFCSFSGSSPLELLSSDPDKSLELSLDCKAGLEGNFGARLSLP